MSMRVQAIMSNSFVVSCLLLFALAKGTLANEQHTTALPTKLDKFRPPIQKVQPAAAAASTTKTNHHKASRGKGQHCSNCSFSLRYESIEGFQVLNGNIVQYQQSRQTLEQKQQNDDDDLVICDDQKCTSSSRRNSSSSSSSSQPTHLVATVEGQCDNKDKRIGQDYLEVNFFAHKRGGHAHVLCPDVNYVVDAVCTTFDIVTGVPKLEQGLEEMIQQGPLLELVFAEDTFASCSIICEDQPLLLHSSLR